MRKVEETVDESFKKELEVKVQKVYDVIEAPIILDKSLMSFIEVSEAYKTKIS